MSITEIIWGSNDLMHVKCLTRALAYSKVLPYMLTVIIASAVLGETEFKIIVVRELALRVLFWVGASV